MNKTRSKLAAVLARPGGGAGLKTYLAVIVFLTLLPIVIVAIYSFNNSAFGQWPPPSYTTDWYAKLFRQRHEFLATGQFSALLALASASLSLVTGGLAAFALMYARGPLSSTIQAVILSPLGAPKIALGLAGFFVFKSVGMYGSFVELWIVHTVLTLPFTFTVVGAGLARVNRSYEEAARDLGASHITAILKVVVPQISRSLAVGWVLAFIISFDEFDATILLANPSDPTLPIEMFNYLEKFSDPSMAALSTVLIVGSLLLVGFVWLLMRRDRVTDVLPGGHKS